jgi:hypothetical protein
MIGQLPLFETTASDADRLEAWARQYGAFGCFIRCSHCNNPLMRGEGTHGLRCMACIRETAVAMHPGTQGTTTYVVWEGGDR